MGIVGIGIDNVELIRFKNIVNRTPRLITRIFNNEYDISNIDSKNICSLAGKFAAKEALSKAFNIPLALFFKSASINNEFSGKPYVKLYNELQYLYKKYNIKNIHLSITHDICHVAAIIIVEDV